MTKTLILNATYVNEKKIQKNDIYIENQKISRIDSDLRHLEAGRIFDASGLVILPGLIDDQVHFREPGLTAKGDIRSESAAAVAGGITSYMEMPNVNPPTTNNDALENKFLIAKEKSFANYSFYIGATNDNLDELIAVDNKKVCGIKIFMGASTGNLLVDNEKSLEQIFKETETIKVTHCEDNKTIVENFKRAIEKYGENIPASAHPEIRDAEACYESSSFAIELAKTYDSQLHVLHLTTEREMELFSSGSVDKKNITAEVCIHHLWFNKLDYKKLGNLIKCNPAIKNESDRRALIQALNSDKIDIIATDHAPHTWQEKDQKYDKAPAGIPLAQHCLLALLELQKKDEISLETLVEKACHNPARRFEISKRGFIKEGYYADLVFVDLNGVTPVTKDSILYKCKWSPFEGEVFNSRIARTLVNGEEVFDGNKVLWVPNNAKRLIFDR